MKRFALRGLLFDLDNTLFAYDPANRAGLAAARDLAARDLGLDPASFPSLHDRIRQTLARELAGRAAAHNRLLFFQRLTESLTGRTAPETALALHETYWRAFFDAMAPAPDAAAVLEAAHEAGLAAALVSNQVAWAQFRKIAVLGLSPWIAAVVTSEEAGADKPDPGVFRLALSKLGLGPDEAVMIGDDPRGDMDGARAAGIRSVRTMEFCPDAPERPGETRIRRLGDLRALLGF